MPESQPRGRRRRQIAPLTSRAAAVTSSFHHCNGEARSYIIAARTRASGSTIAYCHTYAHFSPSIDFIMCNVNSGGWGAYSESAAALTLFRLASAERMRARIHLHALINVPIISPAQENNEIGRMAFIRACVSYVCASS